MTLDGFLTFLSVVLAGYTLSSPATRSILTLRPVILTFISAICFAGVLYLQFISAFGVGCELNLKNYCEVLELDETDGRNWSFGLVIIWALLIAALASRKKISLRHLDRFGKLLTDLITEERFETAANLLEPQIELLVKIESKTLFRTSMHEKIRMWDPHPLFDHQKNKPHPSLKHFKWVRHLFPSGSRNQSIVWDIQRGISNSNSFVGYLASRRPVLAFSLARVGGWQRTDYIELLFVSLLDNRTSAFYKECIETNVPSVRFEPYELERNPFLASFVNDPEFAMEISVWKPPGDCVLRMIDKSADQEYLSFLNSPAVDIERETHSDPLYATIRFFDHMVATAAFHDTPYHMWLYYLDHFVSNLVENYDETGDGVDSDAEHPIRSAYFIWEILSSIVSWIEITRHIPDDSSQLKIAKPDGSHQNDNIPKSAVICISHCLRTIIKSDKVGSKFKIYCAETVFRSLREAKSIKGAPNLYPAFVSSLINPYGLERGTTYRNELRAVFRKIDHVIRFEVDEFKAALEEVE